MFQFSGCTHACPNFHCSVQIASDNLGVCKHGSTPPGYHVSRQPVGNRLTVEALGNVTCGDNYETKAVGQCLCGPDRLFLSGKVIPGWTGNRTCSLNELSWACRGSLTPSELSGRAYMANHCCGTAFNSTTGTLTFFGWSPSSQMPLGLCEGDCDRDSDCAQGLSCVHRNGDSAIVPGCTGTLTSNGDYCYPRAAGQLLGIVAHLGATPHAARLPLGLCEGDCDSDSDCALGLSCFQRNGALDSVPGCTGTYYDNNVDHCYAAVPAVTSALFSSAWGPCRWQ
eukprot:COSAG01_NODE_21418_length_903_cov_1.079602_1_plen_281_part_10